MPSCPFAPAVALAVALSTILSVGPATRLPSASGEPPAANLEQPWQHPVDAPVIDFFRPPSSRFGPGNRGLEYDTEHGQAVTAVADGEVVFAGRVGRHQFIVVAHDPELRSTYAFLDRITVVVGQTVVKGEAIATAEVGFHLTARRAGRYVDPMIFLGQSWSVRLVVLPSPVDSPTGRGGPR